MTFAAEILVPPSANNAYANGSKGRYKRTAVMEWAHATVADLWRQVPAARRICGPVEVHILLPATMRGDVDNRIKLVLDALVTSRRIDDDRNVIKVTAEKTGERELAIVTVSARAAA